MQSTCSVPQFDSEKKQIFTFIAIKQDIRDLKVAKEEQDIGFYAGFVGATYFLGRAISAVPWGMFADKYGRKPCIVISILSVIVFNTLFGLSTTYWMAIVTRGLLGLLCGILGPIKAYASEVCRKEHQALGISLVTSSRAIALVIGPAIGGFLAQIELAIYLFSYTSNGALGTPSMANTATSITSGTFLIHAACYFYLLQIGLFWDYSTTAYTSGV
ncbi:protein ZINC INDUCED FACILITATOR-LIKE 1 isoform X1 [Zea mays]|uniref:protein ZINC INDUCED FACILITATOR-LIKE 1 isoform X1 n=1 Tax=Zea mays TaxID=4577 RepID=UPI000C6C5A26|nr:protein ZINC INDUCED FACILITATOR-LIKE 1 isoform X1 [Zea mays]|eukprot:XP_023157888.1 protein ZINC INDUCED FACILITATOR-LIKE 1 [Zea mays]